MEAVNVTAIKEIRTANGSHKISKGAFCKQSCVSFAKVITNGNNKGNDKTGNKVPFPSARETIAASKVVVLERATVPKNTPIKNPAKLVLGKVKKK